MHMNMSTLQAARQPSMAVVMAAISAATYGPDSSTSNWSSYYGYYDPCDGDYGDDDDDDDDDDEDSTCDESSDPECSSDDDDDDDSSSDDDDDDDDGGGDDGDNDGCDYYDVYSTDGC